MRLFTITTSLLVTFALAAPVAAEGPPDAWITTKAKIAVLSSLGTAGTDINVDTVAGRVTLHGTVDSEKHKQNAESAARELDGVKSVRNLLAVVPSEAAETVAAADSDIAEKVRKALGEESSLGESEIEVQSVNAGTVLLAGKAESLLAHQRAIQISGRVEGVQRVASEIESPDQAADAKIWQELDAGGATVGMDAAGLRERSEEAAESVRESAEGMGERAQQVAKDVAGATTDAYITAAAKTRLVAHTATPGMDINIDTRDGVVTLFGTVPSEEVKQKAEQQTRQVSGVKRVENRIQIQPEAQNSPES